jgi:hypothetical protein
MDRGAHTAREVNMEDAERENDEPFEGIDVDSPLGRVRLGRATRRSISVNATSEDDAYSAARRLVRRRIRFYRHLTTYVVVNLILLAFDGLTGDGFWVQWVAGIWGAFILYDFLSGFVFPSRWGREAERRMIEHELRRRGKPTGDQ